MILLELHIWEAKVATIVWMAWIAFMFLIHLLTRKKKDS